MGDLPDGVFLPPTAGTPDATPAAASEELEAMQYADAERRLTTILDRIDDTIRDARRVDETKDVEPETVAVLEALTGAPDAPLSYVSLNRRVREGLTSWREFLDHPSGETDGMRLFGDVMRARIAGARLTVDAWETPEGEPPTEPPTRDPRG